MLIHAGLIWLRLMCLLIACAPLTTPQPTRSPLIQPSATPTTQLPTQATTVAPTATLSPTVTLSPTATATSVPTQPTVQATVAPTRALASATPLPCISYRDAAQFVGKNACVTGNVSSATQSGNTYFINFSAGRDSFYAVSFDLNPITLPLNRGQCIKVIGQIELFNGRPQIVIRSASQVTSC